MLKMKVEALGIQNSSAATNVLRSVSVAEYTDWEHAIFKSSACALMRKDYWGVSLKKPIGQI